MENLKGNITPEAIEDETKEKAKTQVYNKFNEKNYLNDRLLQTENSKELKIRLLPSDKDDDHPFKTIFMHTVDISNGKGPKQWKSYVCIEKTKDIDHEKFGHKCPFCELNRQAFENMKKAEEEKNDVDKERWKKISLENKASEVCIIRCIERGHEEDGPKFWKFPVRGSDKKDPKNLILSLYYTRRNESIDFAKDENNGELPEGFEPENILDVDLGKDLMIKIEAVFEKDGKRSQKRSISVMDYGKNKPLTNNPELREKWVKDEKKWSDVFTVKPYEYLSLIIDGEEPFYDKNIGKWVSKIKKKETSTEEQEEKRAEMEKSIKEAEEKMANLPEAGQEVYVDDSAELPF